MITRYTGHERMLNRVFMYFMWVDQPFIGMVDNVPITRCFLYPIKALQVLWPIC